MKIPRVVLPYCDKDGKPLLTLGGIKVGDTVYRKSAGKLVAIKVTSLNPFTTSGAVPA